MQRVIHEQLDRWKKSTKRKPLIIQGARQVGKTWLMKEFGKRSFENVCYINFENSERLRTLFTQDYNIERIIAALQVEVGFTIEAKNTLLIFDEIQEAERGLTALKYFHEKAPEYFVVAAGSLLGVAMQKKHSFPVGKVDFIQLHPFSFEEFLASTGNKKLSELLSTQDYNVLNTFHQELVQQLRLYYFIGGMPEAIAIYNENKNLNEVRNIQKNILVGYENDFAKYAPSPLVPRLRLVWQNIIGQLAKENKKFIYGQLKNGARAKDFDLAIAWLKDAGLLFKVPWLTKPTIPLISYTDMDIFKLFGLDVGLLGAMADIDPKILLNKNEVMTEFKGAFTEQFICQQLRVHEINSIYYWSAERGTAEIDFVLQVKNTVIPIEVKAEENLQAKSLKVYMEKFNPQVALRSSLSEYRKTGSMINVPLYGLAAWVKTF
jgi:uncharacterized protein